jgi:rod shape determining protein RodA
MLFSIAGGSWEPWADKHLLRFGIYFIMMIALAMVDLRVWFSMAYPVYGVGLLLLVAVELVGDVSLGAQRWLAIGPCASSRPRVMKIGVVLALARYYHGLSADSARLSWKLLVPLPP